ncbi:MaoC family dehydratase [Microbacterium rhizomatis]|uniref:Enoyl-CoA hydratase n=1 Tax=Microbacterium rhizomatis TaxID=1631477 RepID=A0A5J5J0Z9_9MICO|nr:MaoC family dehydratase [Microbacterium rhizomatis]KAA9108206.1 enoyl-CoA hydratase [Microbacterium rhizomatis]
MALDVSRLGFRSQPEVVTWTTKESLLYALAVGAGQVDPSAELAFTTENTEGIPQQVIPSFAVVLGFANGMPDVGTYDPTRAVHAEQTLDVEGPIAPEGRAEVTTTITEMWDKDPHAIVWTETELRDIETNRLIARSRTGAFLGGAGGFGGERGPSAAWSPPDRAPDAEVGFVTRPDQALLYRLTGDRNPLHSDPAFAARGGFPRPILHGMCTYGFAARLLVGELCAGDVAAFRGMSGRFARPVFPGDALRLHVWRVEGGASFRVLTDGGDVVIDRGHVELAPVTAPRSVTESAPG